MLSKLPLMVGIAFVCAFAVKAQTKTFYYTSAQFTLSDCSKYFTPPNTPLCASYGNITGSVTFPASVATTGTVDTSLAVSYTFTANGFPAATPGGPCPGGGWVTFSGGNITAWSFALYSSPPNACINDSISTFSIIKLSSSSRVTAYDTVEIDTYDYRNHSNPLLAAGAVNLPGSWSSTPPPVSSFNKSNGKPPCNQGCADPINIATGNVFERVTDYQTFGQNDLAFIRTYNSQSMNASILGRSWRSNYDRLFTIVSSTSVSLERADGQGIAFNYNGSSWQTDSDIDMSLTHSGAGVGSTWTLKDNADTTEIYAQTSSNAAQLASISLRNGYTQTMSYASGQLRSVTDSYIRTLMLTYAGGLLSTVSTPDGLTLTYGYDASGVSGISPDRLISVNYAISPVTSQTYLYENSAFPLALTGVTDENGARTQTWSYESSGRGVSNSQGDTLGAGLTTLSYNADGTVTVTNPLGIRNKYTFAFVQGAPSVTEIDRLAFTGSPPVPPASRAFTYDANGYLATSTDWNGNTTQYTNDEHGQPTQIVEAYGTAQARSTIYSYHPIFHLPLTKVEDGLSTTYNYDASGNLLTRILADATTTTTPYSTSGQTRTWTYSWDGTGQLLSVQRPKGSVAGSGYTTAYSYAGGTLTSVTDALGHSTNVTSSTGGGLPLAVTDPNGVETNPAYDARLRHHTTTLHTAGGNRVTTFDHDAAGNLTKVTSPDNVYLNYTYDAAHRLTAITSATGNKKNYALDSAGNVTALNYKDAIGTIRFQHSASFDAIGRQLTSVGAAAQTTSYTYDANGNLTGITDPLSHSTTRGIDALNHLTGTTDPLNHSASFTYDAHDRPLSVTDKNGHTTSYVYDGFGEVIQETSPDRGVTIYYYDADGNLIKRLDSSGGTREADYTYDALDRQISRSYVGNAAINVTLTYDEAGHGDGIGRLTSVADGVGSLSRSYDERGAVTKEIRSVTGGATLTTTYGYNPAGRLSSVTYPGSGWRVDYARNADGDISGVTTTPPSGSAKTLASSVSYKPFGPMSQITWGNGIVGALTSDADYRLTHIVDVTTSAGASGCDANADGKTDIADVQRVINEALGLAPAVDDFSGDAVVNVVDVQIVINAVLSGACPVSTPPTVTGQAQDVRYGYDAVGNVLTVTDALNAANSQTLTYDALDQLLTATSGSGGYGSQTLTYDANGNRTSFNSSTYTIDSASNRVTAIGATSVISGPTGNIGQIGAAQTMSYDHDDRMNGSTNGVSFNYKFDAFDQRLTTQPSGNPVQVYQFDLGGKLLTETTSGIETDYVYIGLTPIATIRPSTGENDYIHTDNIGRPVLATSATQSPSWMATYDPFGNAVVSGNPSGPTPTISLRFPGQYVDGSGFYRNGVRDYDPAQGRYLQYDRIGLAGGLNPYAYVDSSPLKTIDPMGFAGSPPPDWPTPPSIQGGPWTWSADSTNSRGGEFKGSKVPGDSRYSLTYAKQGEVNDNKRPYWKRTDPDGTKRWYDEQGNEITAKEAHDNTPEDFDQFPRLRCLPTVLDEFLNFIKNPLFIFPNQIQWIMDQLFPPTIA